MRKKIIYSTTILLISIFVFSIIGTNANSTLFYGKAGENKLETNGIEIEWTANGTRVCGEIENQKNASICCDGAGGAIIVWEDSRVGGAMTDIYAQKIDAAGIGQWTDNGTAICTEDNYQEAPQICCDGEGGAIITWQDFRNGSYYDIYAQKINATGYIQWIANGTPICTENHNQEAPQICCDGTGGAIITWQDYRNQNDFDIYAQRINSTGHIKWTANGTTICNETQNQENPQICCDGASAIITWQDYRNGLCDIYAQKLDSTGNIQWTANGTAICNEIENQQYPQICCDGAGGAIIVWEDCRVGGAITDIYAQKINATGSTKWALDGTAICTENNEQYVPQICCDGAGGAVIVWQDYRSGSTWDIYAQKISATENIQWTGNGTAICTEIQNQQAPQICCNGEGGAVIVWQDYRSGSTWDIYAQNIDAEGNFQWMVNGTAICTEILDQDTPQICCYGKSAIITWQDYRNFFYDIYVQKVTEEEGPDTRMLLLVAAAATSGGQGFLGLSTGTWMIIGAAVGVLVIIMAVAAKKK
ncbi:MAG: hypothetical protein ACFFCM_09915 [Promethearchaeota archaeon]